MTYGWFIESNLAKAPCKDCKRRQIDCHNCCKAYLEYKKRLAEIKQEIAKLKLLERL